MEIEMSNIQEQLYLTKYGRKIWMEKDTWLASRIMQSNGPYQARNLNALKLLVPHSRVTLDIGANVGMNTIEYADFSDHVYSWEPHPTTHGWAVRNLQENAISNTTLFNAGVGDKPGKLWMKVQAHNDGQNAIAKGQTDDPSYKPEWANGPCVDIHTIDQHNLQNVDIIKIDTEGYELKVLRGAENTILKYRPVVQAEIDPNHMKKFGDKPQDIFDWFSTRDYRIENYKGVAKGPIWGKEKGILDYFFIPCHT